jgi:hypothetical protein
VSCHATAQPAANRGKGNGIFGFSSVPNASGVFGAHDNAGTGVAGHSDHGHGVRGTSKTSIGVYGNSKESTGVDGTSTSGTGVAGRSEEEFGLYASAPYEPKLDATGRIDTNAVLAARTRAALLEGLVEIRGNLIINGVELSQLIENIAKLANYVPPPPQVKRGPGKGKR